jgi:HSP20 family protein
MVIPDTKGETVMAIVTRWDPWQQLARMQDEFNDSFSRGARSGSSDGRSGGAWVPAVDVAKTRDAIVFKVDIPGMSADDVTLQLHERTLMISGERREETESEHEGYYSRERTTGAFTRSFLLPDGVEAGAISADATDGVLRVTVPLPKPTEPARIQIRGGAGRSYVEAPSTADADGSASGGNGDREPVGAGAGA